MRAKVSIALASALAGAAAYAVHAPPPADGRVPVVASAAGVSSASASPARAGHARLANRVAYIPAQCFTKTRDPGDPHAKNPCYVCHTSSQAPNYTNDGDLQLTLKLPRPAAKNPWTNLFDPPVLRAPHLADDVVLAAVRTGNYFDGAGRIALAATLRAPEFRGYVPDVWFAFDDAGFDHGPDGEPTGWRAFAYYPFPGTFFPTNGSADDVLIRLAAPFREDESGRFDREAYVVNLAIVEALVRRADVAIDPVDEQRLGVDLDRDGRLARATRVAFDAEGMRYVGLARGEQEAGRAQAEAGFFPVGTEFFHTVRYLDVAGDGATMAPRMKEVRYAKKTNWISRRGARIFAAQDARETLRSPDGTHRVSLQGDRGVYVSSGWFFQGFIEASDGALRPQSAEETAYCEGCHGEIGATTDATFAFARKLGSASPARGWFHWSQRDLHGIPEPRRADGDYEYTRYLAEAGAGDELRENAEVIGRFFDGAHALRPDAAEHLHRDVTYLLEPSPARALDLDRAYLAIVAEQSFDKGRDAVLGRSEHVYVDAPVGAPTGVEAPVAALGLGDVGDEPARAKPSRR